MHEVGLRHLSPTPLTFFLLQRVVEGFVPRKNCSEISTTDNSRKMKKSGRDNERVFAYLMYIASEFHS